MKLSAIFKVDNLIDTKYPPTKGFQQDM